MSAGFAVISGEWKGVVLSCAAPTPSTADLRTMQVFHIKEDDREQNNMASTTEGAAQAKRLLDVVVRAKVTCSCFQGRCLTAKTCVDDLHPSPRPSLCYLSKCHRSAASTEHHGRKGVVQKVIVA